MIQRKQSIYLILAATMCATATLTTLFKLEFAGEIFTIQSTGLYDSQDELQLYPYVLAPLLITGGLYSLISISFFKDRKKQMKHIRWVAWITGLANVALLGFLVISINELGPDAKFKFSVFALTPFLAFLFSILAYRGVKADEELIRSVDRIR